MHVVYVSSHYSKEGNGHIYCYLLPCWKLALLAHSFHCCLSLFVYLGGIVSMQLSGIAGSTLLICCMTGIRKP